MTPEAVELLQRTKAAVLAHPDHFNMDYWFAYGDPQVEQDEHGHLSISVTDDVPFTPLIASLNRCGTTACGAGWIVALSGEKVTPGEPIAIAAAKLIEFPNLEHQACPLFHTASWPWHISNAYEGAETAEDQAEAFGKAVDLWIEVDGDPEAFSENGNTTSYYRITVEPSAG